MSDPEDQALIAELMRRVVHLEDLNHALFSILQQQLGLTIKQFRDYVVIAKAARREVQKRAAESPEESLLRVLRETEGTRE